MQLGRYVVLRELGAGSMGTVYLGYDPELDRRVALKMLKGTSRSANRASLLREAQAMARLRHPRVVTVHDVGEHEGRVYIAMEFIDGITLGDWSSGEKRGWRDVLVMYRKAGEGLAAAHERGLIHRDFKPENVMVSESSDVRVMDFGLARAVGPGTEEHAEDPLESMEGRLLPAATAGHVAGSPAYMAPEQFQDQELTAAADQFAFCVSLWEALCQERPFEGTSVAGIYLSKSRGEIRPVPRGVALPRWLEAALRRGLQADADRRWPSLAALLDALERGRGRWRWQAALLGAGVAVLVGGAVAYDRYQAQEEHDAKVQACAAEGAAIDEVWSATTRGELEAGLLKTGLAFAPRSAETLVPWFDEYRDTWSRARAEVCVHETIARDWESLQIDRAKWCLEDRRLQLEATVGQIGSLDRMGARRAVRVGSYLDSVDSCLDEQALRQLPVPPPELRAGIRAVRAKMVESDTRRYQGNYAEALVAAEAARAEAVGLGWPPLTANARFIEGRSLVVAGRPDAGSKVLTDAYFEGVTTGSTEVAFRAARSLVLGLSSAGRHREAEVWAQHAEVLSPQLDDLGGLDEAEGHYLRSSVFRGLGQYEAAIHEGQKASEIRAAVLGSDHPITAAAYRVLGEAYVAAQLPEQALEHLVRASKVWEETVGEEHPYISQLAGIRGEALYRLGRVDEAFTQYRRCLELGEAAYAGDDHPKLLGCLRGLADLYRLMGRREEAEAAYTRSLAIVRGRVGRRSPTVASVLIGMADLDSRNGQLDRALERCNEALKILAQSSTAGEREIANARIQRAAVYVTMGRRGPAREELLAVVASLESAYGAGAKPLSTPLLQLAKLELDDGNFDAAQAAYARVRSLGTRRATLHGLIGLGEVALSRGEARKAAGLAEEALELTEQHQLGPRLTARARWVLARAMEAEGQRGARPRELAQRALRGFKASYDTDRAKAVEAWLAE